MIKLENIDVIYPSKGKDVHAVKNASVHIQKGEIFGIVGTSGAGKSSLLRTINLLERPVSGKVVINDRDITGLRGDELRKVRLKIGMIFQHFNLIHTKTVYENVAFPLRVAKKPEAEIKKVVSEMLELVGLTDKAGVYPSKLSGGQKQRIGIARAIANKPEILLCDEPTSALDLETTESILDLIKNINRKLNITTVIITHEMSVVKKICDRVVVMNNGTVVEEGDVFKIFSRPENGYTKQLVNRTFNIDVPYRVLKDVKGKIVKLIYRGLDAEHPVISDTLKQYNIELNILHGKIEYIDDQPFGILVVAVDGKETENAVEYIKNHVAELEVIKSWKQVF